MELAFSLICGRATHFSPNHRIKMYIEQNGETIADSIGEDVYECNGILLADTPIAATGRKLVHEPQPVLAARRSAPGITVDIPAEPDAAPEDVLCSLTLCVDNNLILSQGELQDYFSLEACVDGEIIPIPLNTPFMDVSWESKGLFKIELAGVGMVVKS